MSQDKDKKYGAKKMGYTGAMKSQKISIRVTEETFHYIGTLPGKNLSDKFGYLINQSMGNAGGGKEAVLNEISKLQESVDGLCEKLKESHSPGELFQSEEFLIKTMLKQSGYKPDMEITARIMLLNAITGHNHSLRDIREKWEGQKSGDSHEAAVLIKSIAEQLGIQEQQKSRNVELCNE